MDKTNIEYDKKKEFNKMGFRLILIDLQEKLCDKFRDHFKEYPGKFILFDISNFNRGHNCE